MKRIFFTVTNDLTYDQRMIRICSSLAAKNYTITLVGRKLHDSVPLERRSYSQKRLNCFFNKGKLFYAEYNIRLFFYLLWRRMDIICAIDLDTILPCLFISELKKIPRVYDAHELFCEMKEVITRPSVYKFWKRIEKFTVPKFKSGYSVNQPIAEEFKIMYGVQYHVIRNIPVLQPFVIPQKKKKYILYQGAVNEGRSFETLIPAMRYVEGKLVICGDGNFMAQAKELVEQNQVQDKVIFKGKVTPEQLRPITIHAWVGVTLFERKGLSNYFSLGNRFFDYMHAGVPQLCVAYPAYREINDHYNIGILIDDLSAENISRELNRLLFDTKKYDQLQQNCLVAREELNWQKEEIKLIEFYESIL